jgi:hypothetical protein
MRSEGSGKGDQLRYGVDWKAYGENYDAIFGKKERRLKQVFLDETAPFTSRDALTLMRLRESAKKATRKK